MKWYLRGCPVCGGDLHDDVQDKGWVTCLMCARSFLTKEILAIRRVERLERSAPVDLPTAA